MLAPATQHGSRGSEAAALMETRDGRNPGYPVCVVEVMREEWGSLRKIRIRLLRQDDQFFVQVKNMGHH